jgi:ribosomal protein L3 glutamine methyltransferase
VRDWLRYAVTRFNRAGCFYGHGLQDAYDEAVYLILHTLALPLDRLEPFLDACIPGDEREDILEVIEKRAVDRLPAAYITGEAWLGEFRFKVDKRVIIPRSYFAELLHDGFSPWVQDPDAVTAAMDMCTGSGCLAILMAFAFPNAEIVAVDISQDALDVAAANIAAYGLEDRIRLVSRTASRRCPSSASTSSSATRPTSPARPWTPCRPNTSTSPAWPSAPAKTASTWCASCSPMPPLPQARGPAGR